MSVKSKDKTDLTVGLLLILAAGFFGYQSLGLEAGSALRMGPGYFPRLLAGLLFLLGLGITINGLRGPASEAIGPIAWRGLVFILLAPIFFGLTVRGLGFVVSLFFTALIAAQASQKMKPWVALVLALAVTIFSTLVFSYALGLPFQRFGPWLKYIGV